jgi:hypothetical protein
MSYPEICRVSVVSCEINSRLLKCCGLLYSLVDSQQFSVSHALYFCFAVLIYFEKKARSCQVYLVRCCNTALKAVVEESVTKAMGLSRSGEQAWWRATEWS